MQRAGFQLLFVRGEIVAQAPHPGPLPASGTTGYCVALRAQHRIGPDLVGLLRISPPAKLPQLSDSNNGWGLRSLP
jgi:hypothetical protein